MRARIVRQGYMSYLSDITHPLTKALQHFATLPAHQLAGHAANVEFWRSEVEHRKRIIRSYPERFRRLRDAEQAYGKQHGFGTRQEDGWDEPVTVRIDSIPPARPSTRDSERQELLRELESAFCALCSRLEKEGLVVEESAGASDGGPAESPCDLGASKGPPPVS
jgi:hypothetical protein